jgi:hypothetical protein
MASGRACLLLSISIMDAFCVLGNTFFVLFDMPYRLPTGILTCPLESNPILSQRFKVPVLGR